MADALWGLGVRGGDGHRGGLGDERADGAHTQQQCFAAIELAFARGIHQPFVAILGMAVGMAAVMGVRIKGAGPPSQAELTQ